MQSLIISIMRGRYMKKKLFILLTIFLLPIMTNAAKYYDNYKTMNLTEALNDEGMILENKNYQETDDQAIIYLFRGRGCGFCRNFLSFLNSISKDYGKYFKLVSFEVWHDADNSALLNKMPNVTGVKAEGIPYIIIGSKVFDGYASNYDEEIKKSIMDEYNNKSEDIFSKMQKYDDGTFKLENTSVSDEKEQNNNNTSNYSNTSSNVDNTFAIVFWNFIFIAISTSIILYFNNKNKVEILKKINTQKEEKDSKKRLVKKNN